MKRTLRFLLVPALCLSLAGLSAARAEEGVAPDCQAADAAAPFLVQPDDVAAADSPITGTSVCGRCSESQCIGKTKGTACRASNGWIGNCTGPVHLLCPIVLTPRCTCLAAPPS